MHFEIYLEIYFLREKMLEHSSSVRFSGVKDLMKVAQAMLEYSILIRTRHAGIQ